MCGIEVKGNKALIGKDKAGKEYSLFDLTTF